MGAAVAQLLSLINTYRNYRYALTKEQRKPIAYASNTILVVPCKGLDDNFQRNIESFYALDFEPYSLWFVVEDESDPAYAELQRIRETLGAEAFILGHQSQPEGWSRAGDNLIILASEHNHGCFLHVNLDGYCNADHLEKSVRPLSSIL